MLNNISYSHTLKVISVTKVVFLLVYTSYILYK
nr:MAG TPA: hypothetical protein [Caudoviricetes sp.]